MRGAHHRRVPQFLRRAAQRQQRDNIAAGERRVGAVGGVQLLDWALKAQRDVIIAHPGRQLHVDGGRNAHRVGEGDVAALHPVLGAIEFHLAFQQVHPAQQHGTESRSAQTQVQVAAQPRQRGLHLQLRR